MRTYPEPTERTAEVKVSTDDATLFEQRFVADTAAGAIRKYLEANETRGVPRPH